MRQGCFGTVFSLNTDGTGFTTLYEFSGGIDGSFPMGVTVSATALYGTTQSGGTFDQGTVFALKKDGSGFSNLYSFTGGSDGASPRAGLTLANGLLYGTTSAGGTSSNGVVFAIKTDGMGFTKIHDFAGGADGANPGASLVLSSNTLFGTATAGGSSGKGTVFAIDIADSGFRVLHSFTGGANGGGPIQSLTISGNTLYGTAKMISDGSLPGVVFKLNTDGSGFTTLHSFTGSSILIGYRGSSALALSGNTVYGTTYQSSAGDGGSVFQVNTDGTGFSTLHTFAGTPGIPPYINDGGARPATGVILSGNTLYGANATGGSFGLGTVFSLTLPPSPPQLQIARSGTNVIVSWPTSGMPLNLEGRTNLVSTTPWTSVSPAPDLIGGNNTVIQPISGQQQYYRLRQ